jgi:hypothetical protein
MPGPPPRKLGPPFLLFFDGPVNNVTSMQFATILLARFLALVTRGTWAMV